MMKFIQFLNSKKFAMICVLLSVYIGSSLLEGERGLISYYEKQKIKKQLIDEKKSLTSKLTVVERRNQLLNEKIDLDFLEILYRQKFMIGKSNEQIYKIY